MTDPLNELESLIAKLMTPGRAADPNDETQLDELIAKVNAYDDDPPLREAAIYYVKVYRWPVFPLRPRSKKPATKHGFKDATTDIDRITTWWDKHPDHNIGIPTGHQFDVIDVDLPDGPASWNRMQQSGDAPKILGETRTASGGSHFLIATTGIGNRAAVQPGIDIRGEGGYIVAPPSWLGPGERWSWIYKPTSENIGCHKQ